MRVSRAKTVLVVEDDERVRSYIAATLEQHGFAVVECGAMSEARVAANHVEPDCLLTDLVLADGKGSELAAWLRSRHPSLRVAFMSGFDERCIRADNWIANEDAFLPKPFSIAQLLEMFAPLDEEPDAMAACTDQDKLAPA